MTIYNKKIMNHLTYFSFLFILFLFGCGTVKEGFVNQKQAVMSF